VEKDIVGYNLTSPEDLTRPTAPLVDRGSRGLLCTKDKINDGCKFLVFLGISAAEYGTYRYSAG